MNFNICYEDDHGVTKGLMFEKMKEVQKDKHWEQKLSKDEVQKAIFELNKLVGITVPRFTVNQIVNVDSLDMFSFIVKAIHITEDKIEYDLDCGSLIGTWEEDEIREQ